MAYGLHTITSKNFVADGSGRDWFFIGDFEYRNGRRTPTGNASGSRPTRPPGKPRGEPAEMALHKSKILSSGKAKTIARWQRIHDENNARATSHSPKLRGTDPALAATSWQHGQLAGFSRYELPLGTVLEKAGVIRSASAPAVELGPGDHTRGIRAAAPHFTAESFRYGSIPDWPEPKFELADGVELEAAGAIRRKPRSQEPERGEGDHTKGICGKAPHYTSVYHGVGKLPGWQHPEFGSPLKHHFHSVPCYPEVERRSLPKAAKAVSEEEGYRPGDHTNGIKAQRPHFSSTYQDHGQIPGWKGKRYDFGPLAVTRFRLTEWGEHSNMKG
mmetsp:Transcript_34165/g.79408  ORF Transcript_34165/g.79408 Transcript_34165/m.79408 type:complete len:330 (+) Transcript_34165:54-1043(+)